MSFLRNLALSASLAAVSVAGCYDDSKMKALEQRLDNSNAALATVADRQARGVQRIGLNGEIEWTGRIVTIKVGGKLTEYSAGIYSAPNKKGVYEARSIVLLPQGIGGPYGEKANQFVVYPIKEVMGATDTAANQAIRGVLDEYMSRSNK